MKTPSPAKLRLAARAVADHGYRIDPDDDYYDEIVSWLYELADIDDHKLASLKVIDETVKAIERRKPRKLGANTHYRGGNIRDCTSPKG